MVFVWMMIAVSPRVRDRLSVVMVRVTLHEVSPKAIAIAVAIANARYLIALKMRCFWVSVSLFIMFEFCALGAGCVTFWGYVSLAEVMHTRAGEVSCSEVCASLAGTSVVITCLLFRHAWDSKHTDRAFCTCSGYGNFVDLDWCRLGLSYVRGLWYRFVRRFVAMQFPFLIRVWYVCRARRCTYDQTVCDNCSRCDTFLRFCPRCDESGLQIQQLPFF